LLFKSLLFLLQIKKQWNKLIVRENCHPAKASLLILVQIPLWISLSMSIRNLCYMLPKQDASMYDNENKINKIRMSTYLIYVFHQVLILLMRSLRLTDFFGCPI